jgi:hypothetical protein
MENFIICKLVLVETPDSVLVTYIRVQTVNYEHGFVWFSVLDSVLGAIAAILNIFSVWSCLTNIELWQ